MAYMNQERKAKIAKVLKPVLSKYGVKGTLSVRSHSTIVLTLTAGKIDFIENFIKTDNDRPSGRGLQQIQVDQIRKSKHLDVNPYWFQEHFTGSAKDFMTEAFQALKGADWYDRSDAQIDYFDTAYYVDLLIGKYNKPYNLA